MILLEYVPTGERSFALSAEGHEPPDWRVLATDVEPRPNTRWNASAQAFEEIPPAIDARQAALDAGPWRVLRDASPDEIAAMLRLEDPRAVIAALVLEVQRLRIQIEGR